MTQTLVQSKAGVFIWIILKFRFNPIEAHLLISAKGATEKVWLESSKETEASSEKSSKSKLYLVIWRKKFIGKELSSVVPKRAARRSRNSIFPVN